MHLLHSVLLYITRYCDRNNRTNVCLSLSLSNQYTGIALHLYFIRTHSIIAHSMSKRAHWICMVNCVPWLVCHCHFLFLFASLLLLLFSRVFFKWTYNTHTQRRERVIAFIFSSGVTRHITVITVTGASTGGAMLKKKSHRHRKKKGKMYELRVTTHELLLLSACKLI